MNDKEKEQVIKWLNDLKTTENDPHCKLFTKAVRVIHNTNSWHGSSYSYSNDFGDIENNGHGKITIRMPKKIRIETTPQEMMELLGEKKE